MTYPNVNIDKVSELSHREVPASAEANIFLERHSELFRCRYNVLMGYQGVPAPDAALAQGVHM